MVRRLYLDGAAISEALLHAGFDLKPEDCLMTKFDAVAEELSKAVRQHVRDEIDNFVDEMCWELH